MLRPCREKIKNLLVEDRRKKDRPEIYGRVGEFDRNQCALRAELGRTRHMRFRFILGGDVFDGDLRSLSQCLGQLNQSTSGADGVRRTLDLLGFAGDSQAHRNA